MKKNLLFLLCILWLFSTKAFATVGGELLISDIYYNQTTNSYRYAMQDFGGRGGSIIYDYYIDTEIEKIYQEKNSDFEDDWIFVWTQEQLDLILKNWWSTQLKEINLSKFPITFELMLVNFNKMDENYNIFVSEVYDYDPDDLEYFMPWDITSYIWQNSFYFDWEFLERTNITTCRLDAINYRWFWIPWKDFLLIVISASKWDCFEWWYIKEIPFHISNIESNDFVFMSWYSDIILNSTWNWTIMNQTKWWKYIQLTKWHFQNWLSVSNKTRNYDNIFYKFIDFILGIFID